MLRSPFYSGAAFVEATVDFHNATLPEVSKEAEGRFSRYSGARVTRAASIQAQAGRLRPGPLSSEPLG